MDKLIVADINTTWRPVEPARNRTKSPVRKLLGKQIYPFPAVRKSNAEVLSQLLTECTLYETRTIDTFFSAPPRR